jgi:hypothetical protein
MILNTVRKIFVIGAELLLLFAWSVPGVLAEQPVCDPIEGGSLSPCDVPKYVDPLVIPPAMHPFGKGGLRANVKGKGKANGVSLYKIAVRQFQQRVLPSAGLASMGDPFPKTTVWGYGRLGDPLPGPGVVSSFNYPAFTVEVRSHERVRVHWVNGLMDEDCKFLSHLLPKTFPKGLQRGVQTSERLRQPHPGRQCSNTIIASVPLPFGTTTTPLVSLD